MSDIIHLVKVEGADEKLLDDVSATLGAETDDNIIVTNEFIDPLSREDAKYFLEQFADALDMELVDE